LRKSPNIRSFFDDKTSSPGAWGEFMSRGGGPSFRHAPYEDGGVKRIERGLKGHDIAYLTTDRTRELKTGVVGTNPDSVLHQKDISARRETEKPEKELVGSFGMGKGVRTLTEIWRAPVVQVSIKFGKLQSSFVTRIHGKGTGPGS